MLLSLQDRRLSVVNIAFVLVVLTLVFPFVLTAIARSRIQVL